MNSSLDVAEMRSRQEDLNAGNYQLLHVAPERLMNGDFAQKLAAWKVGAIAVDEAHCISEWGHETLSTYGIGRDKTRAEWTALGRQLLKMGPLQQSQDGFPTISLTREGLAALKDERTVTLTRPPESARGATTSATVVAKAGEIPCDEGLFAELRALRKELAFEQTGALQPAC